MRHLSNDQDKPEVKSTLSAPDGDDGVQEMPKPIEFGGPDDYQLQQAINLLQGKPVQESRIAAKATPNTDADPKKPASDMGATGIREKILPQSPSQEAPPEKVPPALVPGAPR